MIAGTTRLAAVIGSPVRHSRSPAIHNAAFAATGLDWVYVALEVALSHIRERRLYRAAGFVTYADYIRSARWLQTAQLPRG